MKQLEAEIASSTFALVTRTELRSEGLYELVWQDGWKINGVATRPDAGVI